MKYYFQFLMICSLALQLAGCNRNITQMHEETIRRNLPTVEAMWQEFLQQHPDNPQKETPLSFYFCDNRNDADECADLVVKGIKQATATSLWWYEKHGEALPGVGDQYVVTDWEGRAVAVIETTAVVPTPYNEISAEFAAAEGEGDKSLAYWKRVHEAYYNREMAPYGESFSEDMIIVCEHFRVIYPRP